MNRPKDQFRRSLEHKSFTAHPRLAGNRKFRGESKSAAAEVLRDLEPSLESVTALETIKRELRLYDKAPEVGKGGPSGHDAVRALPTSTVPIARFGGSGSHLRPWKSGASNSKQA